MLYENLARGIDGKFGIREGQGINFLKLCTALQAYALDDQHQRYLTMHLVSANRSWPYKAETALIDRVGGGDAATPPEAEIPDLGPRLTKGVIEEQTGFRLTTTLIGFKYREQVQTGFLHDLQSTAEAYGENNVVASFYEDGDNLALGIFVSVSALEAAQEPDRPEYPHS